MGAMVGIDIRNSNSAQMPPEGEPDETGMKEAVVPVDANMITGW